MDTYTYLALDWLANQSDWTTVTDHPQTWAHRMGERIFQRTRELTDQPAPSIPGETFADRVRRLNRAWQTAEEIAIDEHLPPTEASETARDWTPLLPDLSDLL